MSHEVLGRQFAPRRFHSFEPGKTYRVTYQGANPYGETYPGGSQTFVGTYIGPRVLEHEGKTLHLHDFTKVPGGGHDRIGDHWDAVYQEVQPNGRRSKEQTEAAREALLPRIGEEWATAPMGAVESDLSHLERTGRIESRVEEFYRNVPTRGGDFGGSVSVRRKQKKYRIKPTDETQ